MTPAKIDNPGIYLVLFGLVVVVGAVIVVAHWLNRRKQP